MDAAGAEKAITKTGEGAETKYTVGESELVALLNEWAKANDAAEWENSTEEPYAPVFKTASDAPTPWDGTVDTSWYDASKDTFEISTAAELAGLAKLVNGGNNFSGKTIKLTADIDLNSKEWTPIGTQGNPFKGEFDGSQHSVVGLKLVNSIGENGMIGLFGSISGGTVSNLTVSGEVSDDKGFAFDGGIAGNAVNATIRNCVSSVKIIDTMGSYIGGIAGNISGNTTIKNCSYTGEMSGVACTCAGGIVGQIEGSGKVQNSYAVGTLAVPANGSDTFAGGIVGYGGTAQNCYYLCKVNGEDKSVYMDAAGAEKAITKTGEGAETKYTVGESELVALLNEWAKANDAAEWENSTEEPYAPVFKTASDAPEENKVTVTYYANGGTGSITDTVDKDTEYTIRDGSGFSCKGKKLVGWNTSADGMGTSYEFAKKITVSEDLKLYAVWKNIWEGSGTETDPYRIQTAEDWAEMQAQAAVYDNYTGVWFSLTASITLPEAYEPFGFSGNLDGGGHSITVQIPMSKEDGKRSRGLFSGITSGGKGAAVRNLTIEGSVTTYQYAGGLAGTITGSVTLENVVNRASVTENGIGYGVAGGLCGEYRASTLTVKNCRNEGAVTGHTAGGLVGSCNGTTMMDFSGCTNSGTVRGEKAAAGLLGFNARTNDPTSSFTNCSNTGEIIASGRAAGIAVLSTGGKVEGCTNSGAITGDIAAGILCSGVAKRSVNTGKITGKTCGAGIAANNNSGYMWYTMEFCANFGEVTAAASVNGLLAFGIARQGKISNCFTYNKTSHVPISGVASKQCTVSDSYYLANSDTEFPGTMGGTPATLDDFASGKVAWGVDGGINAHKNYWTQGANNYPVPIGEGTSTSYYRAKAECGTGGTVTIKRGDGRTGDADNAVYGPSGTNVTVTATPKDSSFALKSLTLDLMSTGTTSDHLANPGSFALGAANAKVVATFASAGSGGGSGSGSGSGSGTGAGDESDEGLQDGVNMDVEYNVKGLVLSAYTEWGSNGGGKTFSQWLKDSPNVLRALIANSLDNMAVAAAAKKTDEASALAQALLASLNEHSGVTGKDGDAISKALQRFMTSGTEATFGTWLTTGSGMASGTVESIFTQYTDSLLALADRLYAKWESSGTSMTFPAWLDAQQVSMENLSETAEEPDTDTTDESQTTEAPEDVPDGQESEGQVSGNSIWEIIGTAVRENPIIVWSIVAVVAALVIVGAVRRYHKVKRDERDDNGAE